MKKNIIIYSIVYISQRTKRLSFKNNLLLGKILTSCEILRELAASELNGECSRKVCSTCCQSLLIIQFLLTKIFKNKTVNLHFLEISRFRTFQDFTLLAVLFSRYSSKTLALAEAETAAVEKSVAAKNIMADLLPLTSSPPTL